MEEVALALILPLIGGFLYVDRCLTLKYRVVRDDGHRFYFTVAYYGLCLLVVASVLVACAYGAFRELDWFQKTTDRAIALILAMHADDENARMSLALLATGLASVVLGRVLPMVDNLLWGKVEALRAAVEGNDLERFLFCALADRTPVSVTLTSNKVYVGVVLSTPDPSADRKALGLLPLMSGYRAESGKVIFTTFYDEIYAADPENADEDHFKLILFIDKMVSISLFDANVYARFNANGQPALPRRVKLPPPRPKAPP